jgi:hypothetical protein
MFGGSPSECWLLDAEIEPFETPVLIPETRVDETETRIDETGDKVWDKGTKHQTFSETWT